MRIKKLDYTLDNSTMTDATKNQTCLESYNIEDCKTMRSFSVA